MSLENPMTFIQSLKGAPASVLLALAFTGRPMSNKELQRWTRCGHSQVTLALRSLVELGWASARSARGPWSLAKGRHLPVIERSAEASALKALNDDDALLPEKPSSSEEQLTTNAHSRQLLEVLLESGIEEPTASELTALPHVTAEYIRAHVEHARAQGLRVGVAIQRMRLAAPIPPQPRSRSDDVAAKIRRFAQGDD